MEENKIKERTKRNCSILRFKNSDMDQWSLNFKTQKKVSQVRWVASILALKNCLNQKSGIDSISEGEKCLGVKDNNGGYWAFFEGLAKKMCSFLSHFCSQKFVDNTQQCFALLPQANFPANNLNFHSRWGGWNQI